jgi:hypothetical protein
MAAALRDEFFPRALAIFSELSSIALFRALMKHLTSPKKIRALGF